MTTSRLEPVEYNGDLVGLVSAQRVHIVAPWLLDRPAGDPELKLVVLMCMFCSLELRADGAFAECDAEAWARGQLLAD